MRALLLFGSLLFAAHNVFAAPMVAKSAKKAEADRNSLSAPQVIEVGDNVLGVRAGNGAAFDDATVLGMNFEHIVRPNFGLTLQAHYANYSRKAKITSGFNTVEGDFDNTAWTIVGGGNFHVDMFKVRNLDTYFTGGVAHSFISGKFKLKSGPENVAVADQKSQQTRAIAYFNLRYFVDSKWSFTVSAGTGLGNFGLGMDMLF